MAVHRGGDALAAYLAYAADAGAVDLPAVGGLKAAAYGMRARALGEGGELHELCVGVGAVVDAVYLENALCQRAGLVEDDYAGLAEGFEIVGALHEHAGLARAADSGEKAQRYAYHQRAGAARDEEGERAVHPGAPVPAEAHAQHSHERRYDGEREGAAADGGGVYAREAAYEGLAPGFARGGVLDEVEYFADRALAELLSRAYAEQPAHIDAAGDYLVAHAGFAREALAGEGGGIERALALYYHAVYGHLLARLDDYHRAGLDLVGVDALERAAALNIRIVGPDVHELGDVAAGLAHGVALEPLAYLVEEHDGDGLRVVAAALVERERYRADRGDGH